MLAIYIDAGNDRNGNPKRGWIITDRDGAFTGFVDEGYGGIGILHQLYGQIPSTQRIEVTKSVYNDAYHHAYGGLPSVHSQRSPRRGR
jgi:hypothetical protein